MTASIHADHIRRETFAREPANLPVSTAPKVSSTATDHASVVTVIALSVGGVLTVMWAGVLVWSAGYVIGIW